VIFRLYHGGVRENLALTPIIHEWRLRKASDTLFVETMLPEIFQNNPEVDGVGPWFDEEAVIDFDLPNDPGIGIHPIDLYALTAFGDNRLQSRRMRVFSKPKNFDGASDAVFVGWKFAERHRDLHEALMRRFSSVCISGYAPRELGDIIAWLNVGKLFVGCDEDITWLAMASDIPIVMLCGPRQPSACQPFREGVPFEAVVWKCELMDQCLKKNVGSGFGNIYHVYCRKEPPALACENRVTEKELMTAVERVLLAQRTRC